MRKSSIIFTTLLSSLISLSSWAGTNSYEDGNRFEANEMADGRVHASGIDRDPDSGRTRPILVNGSWWRVRDLRDFTDEEVRQLEREMQGPSMGRTVPSTGLPDTGGRN